MLIKKFSLKSFSAAQIPTRGVKRSNKSKASGGLSEELFSKIKFDSLNRIDQTHLYESLPQSTVDRAPKRTHTLTPKQID